MAPIGHLTWELLQAMGLGLVAMPAFATGLFAIARISESLDPARSARRNQLVAQRSQGYGRAPR